MKKLVQDLRDLVEGAHTILRKVDSRLQEWAEDIGMEVEEAVVETLLRDLNSDEPPIRIAREDTETELDALLEHQDQVEKWAQYLVRLYGGGDRDAQLWSDLATLSRWMDTLDLKMPTPTGCTPEDWEDILSSATSVDIEEDSASGVEATLESFLGRYPSEATETAEEFVLVPCSEKEK